MLIREVANLSGYNRYASVLRIQARKHLFLPSAQSQETIHITSMMTTVPIEGCATPNIKLIFTVPINVCWNVTL